MNQIILQLTLLASLSTCAIAAPSHADHALKDERMNVVARYITDLSNADYKDITQLFEKNAIVISTSRGEVEAKVFFYSFLPNIATANAQINKTFLAGSDQNHIAARFHFNYKMKDGEEGDGEYVDEFVFTDNSAKLSAVYMFENIHFKTKQEIA